MNTEVIVVERPVTVVEVTGPSSSTVVENTTVEVIEIGISGPQGIPGEQGPQGDPGPQGEPGTPGDAPQSYHHVQSSPSATWVIVHNLGYNPAGIVVIDSAGTEWDPDAPSYDSVNQLTLTFHAAFGGTADLS